LKKFSFDLKEEGQGLPVLLLPGSYATPAAWKGVQAALKTDIRTFSTSLPGYGTTPEVRPDGDANIKHLVEFVGQVVDAIDEPLHIVGHSWGAHVLLAAVLAQRVKPLSLVCFEANPIFACPAEGPFPWRLNIEKMVGRFETALAAGEPDAASIIIDFYSRPGTFLEMPENVRAFCRASAVTNLRDWHTAATFTPTFESFSSFDLPVTLVRGSETPVPIVDVNEQLIAHIPRAIERIVDGADHFLISTHPSDCAEILDAHLARM
jgi:pimeloyl-ACP methyl ester carboxylesterase